MKPHHLVRAHDPVSSQIAAERVPDFGGQQWARILKALALGPATAKELQLPTGLTVVQIDRRLPDLRALGLARVVQVGGQDLMRDGFRVWEAA
ncbi:hypothetical protein [Acidovorax sp. NCPPB 4044]|uniref:hypothetical protein n=1 Tax=Acidovorax sp. NCPPB 4044 TaxID=2940490 RepID=UPI0023037E94|nr:hypothetical protein [Acidovorax sp. NCPPB 4044]MDA8522004.1 hypothetical protein [Acidovorax sp. NCPPB 4044]